MQGRLLPKYKDRFQAHPFGYWEKEFNISSSLKLDLIEFIFDYDKYQMNPLINLDGIEKIKKTSKKRM